MTAMTAQARGGVIRIASNYLRLGATFVVGIAVVRLLLEALGADAYGVIALLGASTGAVGLASMVQDVIQRSLNRELGAALASVEEGRFLRVYNSALVVALGAALVAGLATAVLLTLLPLLDIPEELLGPARLFTVAKGAQLMAFIALAPAHNMYIASERFVWANVWLTLDRLCYAVAALAVLLWPGGLDPARGIVYFGAISAGLSALRAAVAVALIVWRDTRLRPRLSRVTAGEIRAICRTGGWYGSTSFASKLHFPLDQVLMNLWFGVVYNTIFGLAAQLSSYVRMLAVGVTHGVDVVAARLSAGGDRRDMAALTRTNTKLHAMVALPAAVAVAGVAAPALRVWAGDNLEPEHIAFAATIVRLVVIGVAVQAIGEGWVALLYGSGRIAKVAPYILAAGLLNPVLAVALWKALPDELGYTAVAWSFLSLMLCLHLVVVPAIAARAFGLSALRLLGCLVRPAVCAVGAAPALFIAYSEAWGPEPLRLFLALALYGALYAALTLTVGMTNAQRRVLLGAVRSGLRRKA